MAIRAPDGAKKEEREDGRVRNLDKKPFFLSDVNFFVCQFFLDNF